MLVDLIWNTKTRAFILWLLHFFPIRKRQIICVSWGGAKYNCNPRAIIEKAGALKLIENRTFEVFYAFFNPNDFVNELPQGVKGVEIGSLEYYYRLATSHFIITNSRFSGIFFPYKKSNQIYLYTGHGCGIKKVELDAPSLSETYLKIAAEDTSRIDVMLSCSDLRTRVLKSGYRFEKTILQVGFPRNDMFFKSAEEILDVKQTLISKFETIKGKSLPVSAKYLVYAPTFRKNGRKDVYGFEINRLIGALESRFGGEWYLLISSHPNMRSYYKEIYDFSNARVIDVGNEDLQPILLTSDALITDYSSAEMDFALTKRPIFQLCRDRADYDRGFYIEPEDLPFPYAENDDQLIENIKNFDNEKYQKELEIFNRDVIGLKETGHAAEAVVEWMIERK